MAMQVWKYEVKGTRKQIIEMPKNSEVLTVETVRNKVVLYAMVDTNAELVKREIIVEKTGWDLFLGREGKYLGTFKNKSESLVFHIFIKPESSK